MKLTDFKQMGMYGEVGMEYSPERKMISIAFYPATGGPVQKYLNPRDLEWRPGYELNELVKENKNFLQIVLFTAIRLEILDGQLELIAFQPAPKLRFLLLKRGGLLGGDGWCEVKFHTEG